MDDKDIEKMITSAADHLPIPWERLWLILQKMLQYTLKEKETGTENKEEYEEPGRRKKCSVQIVELRLKIRRLFARTVERDYHRIFQ